MKILKKSFIFKDRRVIIIEKKSTQEWIAIKNIYSDGIIELNEGSYLKILEVVPINYNLKSELEKEAILNSYKLFFKTCNFNIQILIQSNKEDLTHHISKIRKNISKKENKYLKNLAENYINYISQININKKSASKKFYIIIKNNPINKKEKNIEILKQELKEKYLKIKECLSRCGNAVIAVEEKEEILKIFFSFLNTKKYLNKTYKNKEE